MHVHHVRYIRGLRPWEYNYVDCETLCAGCHAREHGILPPVDGWDFVAETDTGDLTSECEYCGTAIRYVFLIHHPKWEPMEVGCVCCDVLTGTSVASDIQKMHERRDRFADSPRWKKRNGRPYIKQGEFEVEVFVWSKGARLRIGGLSGKKVYPSELDARRAAFDVIESGDARRAIERVNARSI